MSPLELVDDRFDKLAEELRASRPVAPVALRAQVRALEPPGPRWTFRWPSRRVVLALAGAALLASFVAAGVTGLSGSSTKQLSAVKPKSVKTIEHGDAVRQGVGGVALKTPAPNLGPLERTSDLAPTAGRLQRYQATMRLRVKNVDAMSSAAKRAMNLAHGLGGYVASVQYATRSKGGGATLVLRVPVGNVQTALTELASLGTILQQHTGILDVTRRVDREALQIAELERQLAHASPSEAPVIRAKLATLRAKHARLLKSARLARITLGLTTPAKQAAAAPSRFDRTVDDAGSVLLRELEILLYALVVAGPLLLLGAVGIAAARAQRRRADARLLERA
ncbi:MAG TPA: DUF4349 domain-containing protein [Gaiellaceae bacterium]|nr:DUF4349 domain-containing protein [Gaiellaceae bacterium]